MNHNQTSFSPLRAPAPPPPCWQTQHGGTRARNGPCKQDPSFITALCVLNQGRDLLRAWETRLHDASTSADASASRQGSGHGTARGCSPKHLLSSKLNVCSNSSSTFIYHPSAWFLCSFLPILTVRDFFPQVSALSCPDNCSIFLSTRHRLPHFDPKCRL